MPIKKFQKNGTIAIPKVFRQQLTSDEVDIKLEELNGKNVIILEPTKTDKQPVTIYK